jgi:pimeloyl-ACP methyl ester carboxylesterase
LHAARTLDVPVLLVSGGRSDVVSAATVREFLDVVPQAIQVELPHATHTLAGDDNAAFTAAIEPFLNTLEVDTVTAPRAAAVAQRGSP